MHRNIDDTIVAISTATGGALAVIRVSGKKSFEITRRIWKPLADGNTLSETNHAKMRLGNCDFGNEHPPEKAYAVFFKAPKTYTGEDLTEIHCHGGSIIAERILKYFLKSGARQAEPGEFTLRAFLNGKIDLSQAEAVADLIGAKSELALDIAERQLEGLLGKKIKEIETAISEIVASCETELDFAEENDIKSNSDLAKRAEETLSDLNKLLATARDGMIIRDGFRIVIAGHPNAGKSSLFNLLLGRERAIVTELPGTTRDTIEEDVLIGDLRATLIDTAGLREAEDIIEKLGIQRSKKSIQTADMILWVFDPTFSTGKQIVEMEKYCSTRNFIPVWNKSDLFNSIEMKSFCSLVNGSLAVSSKNADGLDLLKDAILAKVGVGGVSPMEFAINARHQTLLTDAISNLSNALEELRISQYETATLFLRNSISSLRQITGEEFSPDVLDIIFSRFCIGK